MPERKPAVEDVSFGVRVAALWSVCVIVIVGALWLLVMLLNKISLVTIAVTIAVMMCALLEPAVSFLHRHRMPRALAAITVFICGIAIFAFLIWFVITQISNSRDLLVSQLNDAASTIRSWLITGPLKLTPKQADSYTVHLADTISDHRKQLISGAAATAGSALGVLSGALFCLFATLFLLLDNGTIWRWFGNFFPTHTRTHVGEAGTAAWRTLTAYMRSLVILAAINALAMVPVMYFADMPLVIPLAVLLFLGSLVPLIGPLVAGAVVGLIALVTNGVGTAVVVVVAFVLIVQLFGNLLNPYILGRAVDIHPLAILVTVTAGTLLAGMFGAFVAVPLVAVVNNAAKAVREHHRAEFAPMREPA